MKEATRRREVSLLLLLVKEGGGRGCRGMESCT
jgi:hypothetical protein